MFHGRNGDPDTASNLVHGLGTKPSLMAGQLVNPDYKTKFQSRVENKKEESVYASRRKAPLGRSHDQKPGLPDGIGPYDEQYGIPTYQDMSGRIGGDLVNPPKSWRDVEAEGEVGKDLYKKSHKQLEVGEKVKRDYDWSRVPLSNRFGIETPHDNRGLNTQKTLVWSADAAPCLTSKRLDDYRERSTEQVGLVHDPIKDTLNVAPDHTHGVLIQPDECGAGDLIHNTHTEQPVAERFVTSYSKLAGTLEKTSIHHEEKPSGVATVRTDLAAPRIRRVGDATNYGDESDAYGLLQPSVYSQCGVFEEDFLRGRDQADIRRIFDSIGVEISHDDFQELWNIASESTPDGLVSVELFRNLLSRKISEVAET